VLTGHGTISMAVEAGAAALITFSPSRFENEKLMADVKCAVERKEQNQENNTLRRALETMSGTASPIFRSASMQEVVRTIERIAPSDVTVLITGESAPARRSSPTSSTRSVRAAKTKSSKSTAPPCPRIDRK